MSEWPDYEEPEGTQPKISRRKLLGVGALAAAATALGGWKIFGGKPETKPSPISTPGPTNTPTPFSTVEPTTNPVTATATAPATAKVEPSATSTSTPAAEPTFTPLPTNTAITFGEGRRVETNQEIKNIKIEGEVDANLLTPLVPQLDRLSRFFDAYSPQLQKIIAENPQAVVAFGAHSKFKIGGVELPTVPADKSYVVEGEPGTLVFFCDSPTSFLSNRDALDPARPLGKIRSQFRFIVDAIGIILVYEQPLEDLHGAYIPPSAVWRGGSQPAVMIKLDKPYPHNKTLLSSSGYEFDPE